MNENINLVEILKDCPKGTKLYSTIYGEVKFNKIEEEFQYPIILTENEGSEFDLTADGRYYKNWKGECTLFPSKDQRDWSKFTAPWYKKDKFDYNTLPSFSPVLVKDEINDSWYASFFSHVNSYGEICTIITSWKYVIPYNDETKHLVGTNDEAPEYYRYWED